MNTKLLVAVVAIAVAGLFFVRAADQTTPAADPRIDKLIQQNEQILKNQDAIMKQLEDLKEGVLQLRRRSS